MPAEKQDIDLQIGDNHNVRVFIKDQGNGLQPLHLAGAEISWFLYKEPHHIELLSKTSEAGQIDIVTPSEGEILVKLLEADTASLKEGTTYTHRVVVRDSLQQRITVSKGQVIAKN